MTAAIVQQYENETLKKIREKDKEQFEDANYANVFKRLDKKARDKILRRFSNARIKKLVNKIFDGLIKVTGSQFEEMIPGIKLKASEIRITEKALLEETEQWAIKLRDDTLSEFTANTLRTMVLGKSFDDVVKEYRQEGSKRKNHAKFIARNQFSNFNAILSKKRMEEAGITKGIWVTNLDGRERESHKQRNGKEFDLSKGLKSSLDDKQLIPGIDFSCRCTWKGVIE